MKDLKLRVLGSGVTDFWSLGLQDFGNYKPQTLSPKPPKASQPQLAIKGRQARPRTGPPSTRGELLRQGPGA